MKRKDQILELIKTHKSIKVGELSKHLNITPQGLNRHLNQLINQGAIERHGKKRGTYYTLSNSSDILWNFNEEFKINGLMEDQVYNHLKKNLPGLNSLSKNVENIFHLAFTEMLNNAIDHSRSKKCRILVAVNKQNVLFEICDWGVGLFKTIREKYHFDDDYAAAEELLKGKLTTQPNAHSGEGIFFTSRMADFFKIRSGTLSLVFLSNDCFLKDKDPSFVGTRVRFEISCSSQKNAHDIYKNYTDESAVFNKTDLYVHVFKRDEKYVSRSQAKRLMNRLENFSVIRLDYKHVDMIGQGFADEIYRVFQNRHPAITIESVNCAPAVKFMIDRARNTAIHSLKIFEEE